MNKKANYLRIAQVSDIHIGPTDEPVQGIDVRNNFLKTLEAILEKDVDYVVFSGDIAADKAEPEAYQWVAEKLKDFPIQWDIMGGNHDKIEIMSPFFDIQSDIHHNMLYYHRQINHVNMVFLDSSTDFVQQEQLQWLKQTCSKIDHEVLMFMHHPPTLSGCLFMDTKYPLKNIDEVRQTLKTIPNIQNIFVGHYHTEKFLILDGKNIHLTPSTMMQIDTRTPGFKMEHTRPGWRYINFSDGRLETEVHYLLESPEPISGPSIF